MATMPILRTWPANVTIRGALVLRSEGMVPRFDVESPDVNLRGMSPVALREVLESIGWAPSDTGAMVRDLVADAEESPIIA